MEGVGAKLGKRSAGIAVKNSLTEGSLVQCSMAGMYSCLDQNPDQMAKSMLDVGDTMEKKTEDTRREASSEWVQTPLFELDETTYVNASIVTNGCTMRSRSKIA